MLEGRSSGRKVEAGMSKLLCHLLRPIGHVSPHCIIGLWRLLIVRLRENLSIGRLIRDKHSALCSCVSFVRLYLKKRTHTYVLYFAMLLDDRLPNTDKKLLHHVNLSLWEEEQSSTVRNIECRLYTSDLEPDLTPN